MTQIPAQFLARFKDVFGTGLHLVRLLYIALLSAHPKKFALAAWFNFMGRLFSLGAFVASIQAIYVAFQSSISHGGTYRGKSYIDMLGVSEAWLPWALAGAVVVIFALPALFKWIETLLIGQIARENHAFAQMHTVTLLTDLFVTQRGPLLMTYMSKFFSGVLFIIVSLCIVAVFRFDLFLLVLGFSLVVGLGVITISLRNVINLKKQIPLRADYITDAQFAYDPTRKQQLHLIRAVASPARRLYFEHALSNWAVATRATFNQAIFTGFAIAAVIVFVFSLEDMDGFQLFLLLYLVIAIRYALNTARETGMMASKVLEARTEMTPLRELYAARLGLPPDDMPPAPEAGDKPEGYELDDETMF